MLRMHEVLDMVGDAFDAGWIDTVTAVDLLAEYGRISRARAVCLLVTTARPRPAPLPEWDGWDGWPA